jgi:hypothetical protein
MACMRWFKTRDEEPTNIPSIPITLVHGVFGSGKSHLIVVLIIFLCEMLDLDKNSEVKILICSATNTAVDRVLLGLLQQDFTSFCRVGSLKKIAKPILDLTLQTSEGNFFAVFFFVLMRRIDKESLREFKSMLKDPALTSKERKIIQKQIDDLQKGKMRSRDERLKDVRVVGTFARRNPLLNFLLGVTCAACSFPILDTVKFPIVLLDECR